MVVVVVVVVVDSQEDEDGRGGEEEAQGSYSSAPEPRDVTLHADPAGPG